MYNFSFKLKEIESTVKSSSNLSHVKTTHILLFLFYINNFRRCAEKVNTFPRA